MQYLLQRNTTYHYNRRTPKLLLQSNYINISTIKRTLSKDKHTAKLLAVKISESIDTALLYIKLGLDTQLIQDTLSFVFPNEGQTSITASKPLTSTSFKETSIEYINTLTLSKTKLAEYNSMLKILSTILPTNLEDTTYSELDKVVSTLQHIPKRTKQIYRKLSLEELVVTEAPIEDRLSNKSINEYLKVLKAILSFCYTREYIPKDLTKGLKLLKLEEAQKDKRDTLSEAHIVEVEAKLSTNHTILFQALKYTGLRPSELLKVKIHSVDNILCFDLREVSDLKTQSSKRLIPIHTKLLPDILELQDVIDSTSHIEPLSRAVTKILRDNGLPTTSTLYSLRHTFITNLINLGADNNIVSSLAGHSLAGNTVTMGRYFKGFDTSKLQEAVELLR